MMNIQKQENGSQQIMTELNILDKILIRWGIVTKNYKNYAYNMQKALDYEHLSYIDFADKYYK